MSNQSGRYKPKLERFRRTGKRSHLLYYLPVFNAVSGERMGVLADLSLGGLLIVGHQRQAIGEQLRVRIEGEKGSRLAGEIGLTVDAEVRWSAQDVNPSYFATGMRFLNIDEQMQQHIEEILHRLGHGGD
ncbi:PilZ domain-containing protein [Halorhodospira halochloris]|uniref:PilZ domain-containing protein n=1 Tax=Halorhodospira halochloris TaxID=1052 RepID=UPI001EE7C7A0|nr:PilZ domain-containing protein [Halorhodospira halochloris]MCG5547400.1 PilZ domain-containing protein [Halorhodospira halochloris]